MLFRSANTANITHDYINVNVGGTFTITNDWKVDFDYAFSNQKTNTLRPGTRYTARNSWVSPQLRLDENGAQVYVDSLGNVVSAGAEGAMPAYDLGLETYTSDGAKIGIAHVSTPVTTEHLVCRLLLVIKQTCRTLI